MWATQQGPPNSTTTMNENVDPKVKTKFLNQLKRRLDDVAKDYEKMGKTYVAAVNDTSFEQENALYKMLLFQSEQAMLKAFSICSFAKKREDTDVYDFNYKIFNKWVTSHFEPKWSLKTIQVKKTGMRIRVIVLGKQTFPTSLVVLERECRALCARLPQMTGVYQQAVLVNGTIENARIRARQHFSPNPKTPSTRQPQAKKPRPLMERSAKKHQSPPETPRAKTTKATPMVETTPKATTTPMVEATPKAITTPMVEATPATPLVDKPPSTPKAKTTKATPMVEATPVTPPVEKNSVAPRFASVSKRFSFLEESSPEPDRENVPNLPMAPSTSPADESTTSSRYLPHVAIVGLQQTSTDNEDSEPQPIQDDLQFVQPQILGWNASDPKPPGMELQTTHVNGEKCDYWVTNGFHLETVPKMGKIIRVLVLNGSTLQNTTTLSKAAKKKGQLENLLDKIQGGLKKKKFGYMQHNRFTLGGLLASVPKVSALGLEQIFPIFSMTLLQDMGIPVTVEQALNMSPSASLMPKLIDEFATASMMVTADVIKKASHQYISFDKADASKGALGGCAKLVSVWDSSDKDEDFPDGKVFCVPLDGDKCGDSSEAVAKCVQHSIRKLGLDNADTMMNGVTTDSGGGGTLESVARQLEGLECMDRHGLVGNCTLHNLNLELAVPFQNILMTGAQHTEKSEIKRDVEQLLYAAYGLEKEAGREECKAFWDVLLQHVREVNPDDASSEEEKEEIEQLIACVEELEKERKENYNQMKRGVTTRWFSIGEAALLLLMTLEMRKKLAQTMDGTDDCKTKKKLQSTCRTFLSLVKEKSLLCDLELICAYYQEYFKKHFVWLQEADNLTRKAGFQPFSIFVRSFLMQEDQDAMANDGWKSLPKFESLKECLEGLDRTRRENEEESQYDLAARKINMFFNDGRLEHKKMFRRWNWIEELGFLACFAEAKLGEIMCRAILGLPIEETDEVFESKVHGRDIKLKDYAKFVKSFTEGKEELILKSKHVAEKMELIKLIANGLDIWDRSPEAASSSHYRNVVLAEYGAFFTNNQATERANKEQNLAASNNRQEKSTSSRVAAASHIKEVTE